jgi:Cof subfamily protein (haloacid dehalogenase superfamily)
MVKRERKMETIRLVGLDLDGTLLDNSKNISDRTYRAMKAAAEQGVYLVPVTGRPHEGIPKLVRKLPFVRYLISCNGAAIRDEQESSVVREKLISPEVSLNLTRILHQYQVPYEVLLNGVGYSEQWVYDHLIARSPQNSFLPQYIKETRRVVPHLPSFLAKEGKGLEELFVMSGSLEKQEEIFREVKALHQLSFVFPAPTGMEITAKGVDKGEALLFLAGSLGIARHEVMALGDSGNDLTMLRAAAFPVAMGNAVPEVKAMAQFTTASNEEHGVAVALERFVLK